MPRFGVDRLQVLGGSVAVEGLARRRCARSRFSVSVSGGTWTRWVKPNGSLQLDLAVGGAERDGEDRDVEPPWPRRPRRAGRASPDGVLAVGEQHDHGRQPPRARCRPAFGTGVRAACSPRSSPSPIAVPPSATSGRARP